MNKYSFIFLFLFFYGCIYSTGFFDEKCVTIFIDKKYTPTSSSAEIIAIDSTNQLVLYKIIFNKVRGGGSKLFGVIPMQETNGYKVKRLEIFDNGKLLTQLSIYQITNNFEKMDSINLNKFIEINKYLER
ncbi:MAG: hypothetical protein V3V14_11785 [Saprospiraceae bacterium]